MKAQQCRRRARHRAFAGGGRAVDRNHRRYFYRRGFHRRGFFFAPRRHSQAAGARAANNPVAATICANAAAVAGAIVSP